MRLVFADTLYWIAVTKPADQYATRAKMAKAAVDDALVVTSDEVLTEFLNALSSSGPGVRSAGASIVGALMRDVNTRVIPQSRDMFLKALELFGDRLDKGYSLVDCSTMVIMRAEAIADILTNDHHFAQKGFNVLIK